MKRRRNAREDLEFFLARRIAQRVDPRENTRELAFKSRSTAARSKSKIDSKVEECSETAGDSNLKEKTEMNMASAASSKDSGGKGEAPPAKKASEKELEEFFASAERKERERFTKKYNYDLVRDSPMKGRYEWVRIEP